MAQAMRHQFANWLPSVATLLAYCSASLAIAYEAIVVQPVTRLYRNGPSLHGVGFWRGADSSDICAALTQVDAQFWREHQSRCEQLIRDDILSYIVLAETLFYFYLLYQTLRFAASLCAAATRRFARDRGWLARYSPVVAGWMTHAFAANNQRRRHTPPDGRSRRRCARKPCTLARGDSPRRDDKAPQEQRNLPFRQTDADCCADDEDDEDSPFNLYTRQTVH